MRISIIYILLSLVSVILFAGEEVDKIIVDKSESTLYLIKSGNILNQFHVVFGADPKGHKQLEGDERTPEGNYTLDYKNSHSSFYKSIHVSYPQEADCKRAAQKGVSPGGAIFVHGQKNGWEWLSFVSRYFNWTDGCIALSNSDMDKVWRAVKPGTPIEIRP